MKIERTIRKMILFAMLVCAVTVTMGLAIPTPVIGASLSAQEAEVLTYMREEEKLARDVYIKMFERWKAAIFSNIAVSEQRHMDTMKKMLDKYGLPDPVQQEIGVFSNNYLQGKYDELAVSGFNSYLDALYVGATIEEIDMGDLQHALDGTTRRDLAIAYQNLLDGSKNHLRAFVGALAAQGATYEPQFISQELYNAIIGLQ